MMPLGQKGEGYVLKDILQITFLSNTIGDYLVFLATLVIGILLVWLVERLVLNRLNVHAGKTLTTFDDFLVGAIKKKLWPVLYVAVIYVSVRSLILATEVSKALNITGLILITVFGTRFLIVIMVYALENYWRKQRKDNGHVLKLVITILKIVVWGLALILLLDNLNVKISALLTGLGIGGIALAFAAQAVLGDIFSYVTIYFDRPFEIGDFIVIGEYMGTVEHIGLKTTRVRSLNGEELIIANTDLTNSRVRNYKRMSSRRVLFKFGVTYQTTIEQLKGIPDLVSEIIKSIEETTFERAHFFSYGDFSLIFEVVYYVNGSDYPIYMNIQQEINLRIMEEFEKRGIKFAYPTQTLYLGK